MKNFKDLISEGLDSQDSKQSKGNSLAFQFKDQLNELMKVLNVSSPRYVRWIKPNNQMKPKLLESYDAWRQLRWAGVLEAIRIRKIGYPIRKILNEFIRRYKPILTYKDLLSLKGALPSKMWAKILTVVGFPDDNKKWQIGHTKVFMKEDVRQILERELGNAFVEHVIVIQKRIRNYIYRKRTIKLLAARYITRSFKKLQNQKLLRKTYSNMLKAKAIILSWYRAYLKRKREAERRLKEKEIQERLKYDQQLFEIEEERKRLDREREVKNNELIRLNSDLNNDYDNIIDYEHEFNDNPFNHNFNEYNTPGNPEFDEEYKYDEDAFKEDIDGLSNDIDNAEIAELHNKIEELENKLHNVETEKEELERKLMKEK